MNLEIPDYPSNWTQKETYKYLKKKYYLKPKGPLLITGVLTLVTMALITMGVIVLKAWTGNAVTVICSLILAEFILIYLLAQYMVKRIVMVSAEIIQVFSHGFGAIAAENYANLFRVLRQNGQEEKFKELNRGFGLGVEMVGNLRSAYSKLINGYNFGER